MSSKKAPQVDDIWSDEKKYKKEELVNCNKCGRHFAISRIETHQMICQKLKARKPFETSLQRVKGTEVEELRGRNRPHTERSTPLTQPNWRKQHEEFIQTMKQARLASMILKNGGNIRELPPPPPSDTSDYIQCPHCSRRFNATAAQRHIPKCAEMLHNKPKPKPTTVKPPLAPDALKKQRNRK